MKPRLLILIAAVLWTCVMTAQDMGGDKLPPSQQRDIQAAAVDKVNRFQKVCSDIADKSKSDDLKRRYIKTALKDFTEDARIIITNMDGTAQDPKPVEEYLHNLRRVSERYKRIQIHSYNCYMSDEFVYDKNTGMYVGTARVIQTFNAMTGEWRPLNDVVERTFRIKARKTGVYRKDRIIYRWDVFLSDITGRSI